MCLFPLTLRLLVAVVQSYICGVVHSSCQVLNGAFAKLIHSEDVVVAVGDAIDVVLKDIDAEGVMEHCEGTEETCYGRFTDSIPAKMSILAFSSQMENATDTWIQKHNWYGLQNVPLNCSYCRLQPQPHRCHSASHCRSTRV